MFFTQVAGVVAVILLMNATGTTSQEVIEDIRLANGTYGSHMGRVEVLYNGTWGTICNQGWSYNDARVACRSLGFVAVVCFISNPPSFPPPDEDVPVWMSNLQCGRGETSLDQCGFTGFGVDACPQIGGEAICAQRGIVGNTTNLTQVGATSNTVRLTWKLPPIPEGVEEIRWRVQGFHTDFYPRTRNISITTYSYTVFDLPPNTSYTIRVRTDVRYRVPNCSGYLYGDFSDDVEVRTMEFTRVSSIPVRLVPPFPDVNFMGRIEVMYNNSWGTVCDDNIRALHLANIVCRSQNFSRALCGLNMARYGPGSGPIWMDNVMCDRSHEVLEDCPFLGWGVHNCNHGADYSVICLPNDEYVGAVTGVRVVSTGPTNVVLSWDPFTFPPGTSESNYLIQHRRTGAVPAFSVITSTATRATVGRLVVNSSYAFTVTARYRMRYCRFLISGRRSLSVVATTRERAPSGPPTSVHLVVLNQSAVEVQWNLPNINVRNGEIHGFKVFYQESGSPAAENVVDVSDGDAVEYVVGGLRSGTVYTFSVLAYTGADGPRSIHFSVSTFSDDYVELIVIFGPAGNGIDRAVRNVGQRDLMVHCGSGISDVQLSWFFPNQTEVLTNSLGIRQGKNSDGTSILNVGVRRVIGYCDAGVYTCKATWTTNTSQVTQSRNFTLLVGLSPPAPSSPYIISRGSTWVTLGWYVLSCDGGHVITELVIRYQKEVDDFYITSYSYVYGLDPALQNYTIHNLESQTSYKFSIQAQSAEFRASSFSEERIIMTMISAPSPPLHVTARLVQTPVVEVKWREPQSPNGIIAYYTVYASSTLAFLGSPSNRNTVPPITIAFKRVPGYIGATNITVPGVHSHVEFQVSATIRTDESENEGERSLITMDSVVFVPSANLPIPGDVQVAAFTNTSVTITWTYPARNFFVPILQYTVLYAADVFWTSPRGFLVQFEESGIQNVSSEVTTATITGLVPGTEYYFRVFALTDVGQGEEVIIRQETAPALDDKVLYFKLKIHSIPNCFQWKIEASSILSIHTSIIQVLVSRLCDSCDITSSTVQNDTLRCDPTAPDHAVFRARLVGTGRLSARSMLTFLEHWVLSDTAMVTVANEVYGIDSTCPTQLDSPVAAICSLDVEPTTPSLLTSVSSAPLTTMPTTLPSTMSNIVVIEQQSSSISSGEMGGLVIGVIIIVLLVLFVVLLIVLLVRSFICPPSKTRMKKLTEDVVFTPKFAEDTELTHENPFYNTEKDDIK